MSSRRILVVDDERIVAEDISECLEAMGCEVIGTALSGAEAIEKAASMRPDIIMMDIVIQGDMDGIDAAKIIRDNYDIPSVFLTANSDPGVLSRAKACEPAGYIVKPFEEAGLRSTVEIALYKVEMEHALKESHEWLATTLNSIGDGVIATDNQGRIKFMNPIAETLTGWDTSQATGRPLTQIFTIYNEDTQQPTANPAMRALEEGCVFSLEHGTLLARPDGSVIPIDDSGAPIRDNAGNIIGSVLVFRDVTENRKAEMEVKRHQEHLEELVRERTHKIQKTNDQLTAEIDVRKRTEQALAYKMGMENLISSVSSLFLNLRPSEIEDSINTALDKIGSVMGIESCYIVEFSQNGDIFSLTHSWPLSETQEPPDAFKNSDSINFPWWNLRLSNDEYIFVPDILQLPDTAGAEREMFRSRGISSILAIPMREGSRLIGYLGFPSPGIGRHWQADDLVVLKTLSSILLSALTRQRNENEKDRLHDQLAHSQKMEAVGKLSGGIAHDFNNMLLPIIGYADMLMMTMEDDDPRTNDLNEIRKAADRAASLTRQLLAFSRKQVIAKSVFDLGAAIVDMENMLIRIIGEDVSLVTELEEGNFPVRADVGQIEQVLMNLVINARHAMPAGGTIRLRAGNYDGPVDDIKLIGGEKASGPFTCIEVLDEGTGMDSELIARIFEPFYTTKGLDGTGLGLAVVYGIIEQHDGGIDVQSELGKGTKFRIFLPSASGDQARQAEIQKETRAKRNFTGSGQRILLVEDEPGVRHFVSEALQQNGYDIIEAGSIREANEVFGKYEGQFDLIFSDAVLPDGNGINMLEKILEKFPDMRALLSSGYTDKHNLLGMLEGHNVHFLQKPYPLPTLIETVGEILQDEALVS
ncbi:MAG: two-component system cell cycle sensor histidine kinase/response regulator CckA [Pseudoalteromonas tetraodonis]|jgi:two-component system cell cycle sensor histidine kinase/response regulator CckA